MKLIFRIYLLILLPFSILIAKECEETVNNCPGVIRQWRICFKKPLKNYLKLSPSSQKLYDYALKEFNFFQTIELDHVSKGCSMMANIYTFQLIDTLLFIATNLDSSFNSKANIVMAECYFNWAIRRERIKYPYNGDENIKQANRIRRLGDMCKKYHKAQELLNLNLSSEMNSPEIDSQSVNILMRIAVSHTIAQKEIAHIYKNAPIPDGSSKHDRQEYKAILLKKRNEALNLGIELLIHYINIGSKVRKYAENSFREAEKQLELLKAQIR